MTWTVTIQIDDLCTTAEFKGNGTAYCGCGYGTASVTAAISELVRCIREDDRLKTIDDFDKALYLADKLDAKS